FYCASVVDNRTRLEFHGERRIWDGHFIKKTIKGNSALYVFIEEEHQQEVFEPDSGGSEVVEDFGYESSFREHLGVKRSFDRIATIAELTGSVNPVTMSLSSMNSPGQPIHEKPPDVISTHDGPPGNNTSYSNLVPGQAEKGSEKSDIELSNERPLMSVQQETPAPSNTILFLQQPLGGIPIFMIPTPAGGITVAPAALGGNNALNTVPTQQSVQMPLLPASNSPGLQSAPQTSTLTPQLQSLHISSASQPSQNIVTTEASILGSSEAFTTLDTSELSQLVSLTGPEGDRSDSVGEQQETEKFKSPDQEQPNVEKTDSSQVAEKESAGAIAVSGDQGSSGPFTLQTSESEPLDALDSGFETFGKPEDNSVQDAHSTTAGAATRGDVFAKNVMLLKKEDLVQGNGKILMPTTIEMARMRKTGQYKRQVQFSKSMSEEAVRKTIQEVFPILHGRFSCASISNQDSTLQFHGSPRVWDGRTIRRILKGNSALYVVMEEIRAESGLSLLSIVAAAQKAQENVKNTSGFSLSGGPIEQEQGDVEMALGISDTHPEQGPSAPLTLEDLGFEGSEKSEVRIIPDEGPLEGGGPFILVFENDLPPDVESGRAYFGDKVVDLTRINGFNLTGKIPASDVPGPVRVIVQSNGIFCGETYFSYYDPLRKVLSQLVVDPKSMSDFFRHCADSMAVKMGRTERQDSPQPSAGSSQPNQVSRLLVNTAAKSDVRQLVKMFFNSPAGRAVFLAHKEEKILPESVTNYILEICKRFSEEIKANQEFSQTVNRLEPVKAAEEEEGRLHGYLGDVDTSSDSETSDSDTEDKPRTAFNKDFAENYPLAVVYDPIGIEQNKQTKEGSELYLLKTGLDFLGGQDLDSPEPEPRFSAQERGRNGLLEVNNQQPDPLLGERNMNFDQNSMADKNRRAEEISEDETSDTGAVPL
ncbi:uncharacterized protein LOC111346171, partial [Stylophora pistillata]|uniref:uncharacterized protein LOC111346171 n=1 Tax=Stylophora pistillata TaxID=50429 RepID=UPI000C04BF7F